ncbi:MAG: DNA-binding response regulator, partial [Solirubrobacterales bacterium]|nr:DNA-binding response regulator [Solirubrobacterales bacterium]
VLLREGIARLLTESGFDVVAQAATADDLPRKSLAHHPDLVIADINTPPGHGDDGLQAALE